MKESRRDPQGRTRTKVDPVTQTAVCTRCTLKKDVGEFPTTRRKSKYGIRLGILPWCRLCERARRKAWRETPGGQAQIAKENAGRWDKIKNDPKKLANHRKYARQWQRDNGTEYRIFRTKIKPILK